MSLSTGILLGLVLGAGCGVFFGEAMAFLRVVADAFIRLLQMAVLPYVTTSLITGLGRLDQGQARFLARQGALLLLLFWAVALGLVVLMPLAYPDWQSASFFSTTLVEPRVEFDFVSLYIPANPFRSMADNVVPAVVLFSIALGVGLMRVDGRDTLIANLDVLAKALTRVTNFVVALTPIGVFAIAASAAGTMTVAEFGRLQIYLLAFVAISLIATFWILPGLVPVLTPLRYRDVVRVSRDALITAFSTGSLFVVLPLLVERAKELIHQFQPDADDSSSVIDVLVPVSFNFPHTGKLLTLGFVLFAAWFSGTELSLGQYPVFLASGLLTFFGSVNVAIPFLFDLLRIPADMFQLFVAVGIVNFRFSALVGVMHTLVLSLLAYCAVRGHLRVRWRALLRYLLVSAALVFGLLTGARLFFAATLEGAYQQYELITARGLLGQPVQATVHRTPPAAGPERERSGSALERIRARGVLRVGYNPYLLPFAYFNDAGELVGHDIDLAHRLARDLGVELELIPLDMRRVHEQLAAGLFDVTTGIAATPERFRAMWFSSYADLTLALVTTDHRREQFETYDSIREIEDLRIAVPRARYYQAMARELFPAAEVVLIDSEKEFFEQEAGEIDAMIHVAEGASAWTLLYPQYSVVVPQPGIVKVPIGFALAPGDVELAAFLDTWFDLNRKNGTLEALRRYWVLGQEEGVREPRWSVIRNVLHWVD